MLESDVDVVSCEVALEAEVTKASGPGARLPVLLGRCARVDFLLRVDSGMVAKVAIGNAT